MKNPLRFAVIGTNFISDRFMDAVRQYDGVRVDAVISRKRESADLFADRYGVLNRFDSLATALASGTFDALYVATPNYTHKDVALAALHAGKHVLCEKIITDTLSDFTVLKDAAKENNLVLLEAMRPDFDPAYAVIREALPRLGQIRRADFVYDQYSSRYDAFRAGTVLPAFDPGIGNNALADIGIYPLRVAVSLFGEPSEIAALGITLSNGFHAAGTVSMLTKDTLSLIGIAYSKITDSVRPSVIEGEEGALTFDPITAPNAVVFHPRKGDAQTLYTASSNNNMIYEIQAFADMVKGKKSHLSYLSLTETTLRTYEKIRVSLSS